MQVLYLACMLSCTSLVVEINTIVPPYEEANTVPTLPHCSTRRIISTDIFHSPIVFTLI